MWYAVETAFVDGQLLGSQCCFVDGDEQSPVGHCYADRNEEPHNSCQKEFNDRIEIHVDWFETEELAHAFCDGRYEYYIDIDPLNYTLRQKFKGRSKDGKEKDSVRTCGYFGNIRTAISEYLKLVQLEVMRDEVLSMQKYVEAVSCLIFVILFLLLCRESRCRKLCNSQIPAARRIARLDYHRHEGTHRKGRF